MRTYTIPQKMSGTGTIHDIASDQFDRLIKFAPGCKYAVVQASYYGGNQYTTHKTASAAARAAYRCRNISSEIIDYDGVGYITDGQDLYYGDVDCYSLRRVD